MCGDGPTQAELERERAQTVFSLYRESVCVWERESIVWVNTVCVWRRADTSRAGERESSDCVLTVQRECVCVWERVSSEWTQSVCRDGPTQAELERERAQTVFSLHRESVCVWERESIVWVNTVCVWRRADTSRAGERESSDCVLTVQRECVCVRERVSSEWTQSVCRDGPTQAELERESVCVCVCVCVWRRADTSRAGERESSDCVLTVQRECVCEREKVSSEWTQSVCGDGPTQAELERERAQTVFSLHRESVCVWERESIVWVNTVCVWRRADTSRAGERECVCVCVCVCVETGRHKQSWRERVCVCVCVCVETGRHKQSWRARELRLCSHCTDGLIEDELHFLTECSKYKHIRDAYFKQIALVSPEFQQTSNTEKLSYILGEKEKCIHLAAQYVHSCHQMRDNGWTSSPFTLALCILLIYCFFCDKLGQVCLLFFPFLLICMFV